MAATKVVAVGLRPFFLIRAMGEKASQGEEIEVNIPKARLQGCFAVIEDSNQSGPSGCDGLFIEKKLYII